MHTPSLRWRNDALVVADDHAAAGEAAQAGHRGLWLSMEEAYARHVLAVEHVPLEAINYTIEDVRFELPRTVLIFVKRVRCVQGAYFMPLRE